MDIKQCHLPEWKAEKPVTHEEVFIEEFW